MKRNLGVFIIVMLCAVLCIGLGYFNRDSESSLGWNPNAIYDSPVSDISGGSSFTSATLSGSPSADGSGVALSMHGGSVSSRARVHHYSYAPASSSMSVSSGVSPISYTSASKTGSAGSGLYMTSDAEFHSFGGGGNGGAAMGGSMRGASIANSPSPIANSPISYSPSPIAYSSARNNQLGNNPAAIAATDLPMAASVMASDYGTSLFGNQAIDAYNGTYNGARRSGIAGRQNSIGFADSWWNWLDWHYRVDEDGNLLSDVHWGTYADGTWLFTHKDAEAAYKAWCDYMTQQGMAGMLPSYDDWLTWLMSTKDGDPYQGNYGFYQFIPVGNILPLLLMALLYTIILFVKRNKTAQL